MDHASVRYLTAKRSVDERALSRRVRDRLVAELPHAPRILEAGPGVGLTVPRLLSWGIDGGSYRGIELDPALVVHARSTLPAILRRAGHEVVHTTRGCRVENLAVTFEAGDAIDAIHAEMDASVQSGTDASAHGTDTTETARDPTPSADLVIAQSFMDLVDLADALEAFTGVLRPGGLAYFPITFDGETIFQPDHPRDDAVIAAYHRAIDAEEGRDSRAGRHLAERLRAREGTVLEMAASDWIVRPRDGGYPSDERYFLRTILQFFEGALEAYPVAGGEEWLDTRRRQLARGELTYVAHGYDLLYRVRSMSSDDVD